MKFIIKAEDLSKALYACNYIAPASSAVAEAKTGVLIRAEGETVVFMSADTTSFVSVAIPAEIKEAGTALVRAASATASVSASFEPRGFDDTPNSVTVETTTKSTLKLTGANRVREGKTRPVTRNFPLLNADFFVETPAFHAEKATSFPPFDMIDGLNFVSHAAIKDTSLHNMNCINLTLTENEAIFAATDGVQIAEFKTSVAVNGLTGSFLLGLKFSGVLNKLINPQAEKGIELYVEDDNLFIRSGNKTLVSTLINAEFPDYRPFVTTNNRLKATFPREDFISVLSGMQPTVDSKSHRIILEADTSGNATLSTSSITGEAESTGLDVSTPEAFNLHFDAQRLQSSVSQLKGEYFDFYFAPDANGVILKSAKHDDFTAFLCTLKKLD